MPLDTCGSYMCRRQTGCVERVIVCTAHDGKGQRFKHTVYSLFTKRIEVFLKTKMDSEPQRSLRYLNTFAVCLTEGLMMMSLPVCSCDTHNPLAAVKSKCLK